MLSYEELEERLGFLEMIIMFGSSTFCDIEKKTLNMIREGKLTIHSAAENPRIRAALTVHNAIHEYQEKYEAYENFDKISHRFTGVQFRMGEIHDGS